jgi:hypothetical protein
MDIDPAGGIHLAGGAPMTAAHFVGTVKPVLPF